MPPLAGRLAVMRIAVLLGAATVGAALAQVTHQPEPVELLEHFQESSEWADGFSDRILRMDLDLMGDSAPELLLAKASALGDREQEWFIYYGIGESRYRLLAAIDFSFLLFRLTESRRLVSYAAGLGVLVTTRLDTAGAHEEARTRYPAGGAEWKAFESWRGASGLRVLSIRPADLSHADPPWVDLLTNQTVPGMGRLDGVVVP